MRRRGEGGFTLIEVVVALGIVSVAVILLLERRLEVVRRAGEVRDVRAAWSLLAQKMAELELDPTTFDGEGREGNGDFSALGEAYQTYTYTFQTAREEVATNDPQKKEEKPKELYRLTVNIHWPVEGAEGKVSLTGYFPVPQKTTP